ncbi:MAG: major outer membrane protein, partial [Campylobacter hyointestinalis]
MKLVKMSLAAIVAAGALSSVASATPLEEAIKNVDVSGF